MNEAERNVTSIMAIARVVANALTYCLDDGTVNFTKEDRDRKCRIIKSMSGPNTPFAVNCEKNGEIGKKLAEDTKYFIEDVYDDPGRIVTVDLHGKVNVEKSLIVELYTTIVTLRNGLEAFLLSALKFLKDNNSLEESFETTIKNEIRYYHSFASKVGTILLSRKFIEINENANTYAQSYSKSHGNIDPRKDPKFNPDDDPSIRMLKNEFRKLNIALLTVLNNYDKDDEEFRFARNNVLSDSEIFSGKKRPTDVNAFFGIYTSYFDKIINNSRKEAEEGVHSLSADLREFEAARTKAKEEK